MMLGLATHEPNFYIIREEFKTNMDRPCDICGLTGKFDKIFLFCIKKVMTTCTFIA